MSRSKASRLQALTSLPQTPWSPPSASPNHPVQSRGLPALPPASLRSRSALSRSALKVGQRDLNPSQLLAPSWDATCSKHAAN